MLDQFSSLRLLGETFAARYVLSHRRRFQTNIMGEAVTDSLLRQINVDSNQSIKLNAVGTIT